MSSNQSECGITHLFTTIKRIVKQSIFYKPFEKDTQEQSTFEKEDGWGKIPDNQSKDSQQINNTSTKTRRYKYKEKIKGESLFSNQLDKKGVKMSRISTDIHNDGIAFRLDAFYNSDYRIISHVILPHMNETYLYANEWYVIPISTVFNIEWGEHTNCTNYNGTYRSCSYCADKNGIEKPDDWE